MLCANSVIEKRTRGLKVMHQHAQDIFRRVPALQGIARETLQGVSPFRSHVFRFSGRGSPGASTGPKTVVV